MHQQFDNTTTHRPPHRYQLRQKEWYFKLMISFKHTKSNTKKRHTWDQEPRQKTRRGNWKKKNKLISLLFIAKSQQTWSKLKEKGLRVFQGPMVTKVTTNTKIQISPNTASIKKKKTYTLISKQYTQERYCKNVHTCIPKQCISQYHKTNQSHYLYQCIYKGLNSMVFRLINKAKLLVSDTETPNTK